MRISVTAVAVLIITILTVLNLGHAESYITNLINFTNSTPTSNVSHCLNENRTKCKDGIMILAWSPVSNISTFQRVTRAAVYLFLMIYLFIGVSIVADRFMASIEVITSQERTIKVKRIDGSIEKVNVRIWNETVSNLTLMALGSSAPEIMLSVIETCGREFTAGELGPSTIVGSAAFNLFIIIGISNFVIPKGEVRRIKHLSVFLITTIWMLFAYIWLYLILVTISYGVVDVWEAVLTFLFFPLTVFTGYLADTKIFFNKFLKRRFLRQKIKTFTQDGGDVEIKLRNSIRPVGIDDKMNHLEVITTVIDDNKGDNSLQDDYDEFERHRHEYLEVIRKIRKRKPNIDHRKLEEEAQYELLNSGPKSRAFYRIQATRALTGSKNVFRRSKIYETDKCDLEKALKEVDPSKTKIQKVYFDPGHYTVFENVGIMQLRVVRVGPGIDSTFVNIDFYTEDGSATAWEDYEPTSGRLTFQPGETEVSISVNIVDDDVFEEDEHFFVHLHNLQIRGSHFLQQNSNGINMSGNPIEQAVILANPVTATVMILDDDHPGVFHFDEDTKGQMNISESVGKLEIRVLRSSGARGHITLPYKTSEDTALAGHDFEAVMGCLEFHNDQTEATISIHIIDNAEYEKKKCFFVELGKPVLTKVSCESHAFQFLENFNRRLSVPWTNQIDSDNSGDDLKSKDDGQPRLGDLWKIEVNIHESKELKNVVDHLMKKSQIAQLLGTSSWKEQFKEAISIVYEDENDDDQSEINSSTIIGPRKKNIPLRVYVLHYCTLFWKLIFAFIPPTDIWNGWLCFIACIGMIGLLTAIIGDMASGFGCTVGLTDSITAITFVALGTSLPDTVASKVAAISDPTADSSVGNVIGSNAVNVYLGIGTSWLIGAIYQTSKGRKFTVDPGSLGFSVTLFCLLAVLATIFMLLRRRRCIGGELGGPTLLKYLTSVVFVMLWVIYIVVTSLKEYCHIKLF